MNSTTLLKQSGIMYKFARNWLLAVNHRSCSGNCIDMPDVSPVTIPAYEEKKGESMELRKARLVYQSRKRGMLENGILLSAFAAKYLKGMNEEQVKQYDKLINQPSNDWEIYYWATGVKSVPDEFNNEIMTLLKSFVKNENKECRQHQPDLY